MNTSRKIYRFLTYLSLVVLTSSCSMVFNGKTKRVDFVTYPTGARVFVNKQPTDCITPCSILLKRAGEAPHKTRYYITLQKDGYEEGQFVLKRELDYTPLGLNLLGFYFALATIPLDIISGSAYTFNETYPLHLEPKPKELPKTLVTTAVEENSQNPSNNIPLVKTSQENNFDFNFNKKSDVDSIMQFVTPKNSRRMAYWK